MSDTPEQIAANALRDAPFDASFGEAAEAILGALRDAGWSIVRLEEADEDTLRVVWKGKIP